MRILLVSDLHYTLQQLDWVTSVASDYDLVVVAGDTLDIASIVEVKRTIQDMADVATHAEAVDRELVPQVWSTRQPWFAERIAALQARISSK